MSLPQSPFPKGEFWNTPPLVRERCLPAPGLSHTALSVRLTNSRTLIQLVHALARGCRRVNTLDHHWAGFWLEPARRNRGLRALRWSDPEYASARP
jgi:hypothetical protein